ncbi:MAG TPA: hypothetical protein VGM38_09730 [Pseudolysinimonas sp.]|jgi:hypothetical protein
MSDDKPAPKSGKAAKPKAAEGAATTEKSAAVDTSAAGDVAADAKKESVATPVAEPAGTPAATAPEEAARATATATAPVETEPATATGEVAPADPSMAGQQVVYVETPVPPRARGNRVVGVLLAILGAVIFAAVFAIACALLIDLQYGDLFGPMFGAFLGSAYFWVPALVFLVGLVLLVLILNRAGWWTHVLGSLVLAVAVYFGTIGALLLAGNVFHGSPQPLVFAQLAVHPFVIAAAVIAREVSIWIGLAIAARGRRVKERNVETRTAWDLEQEEKKAEHERTGTAPAA